MTQTSYTTPSCQSNNVKTRACGPRTRGTYLRYGDMGFSNWVLGVSLPVYLWYPNYKKDESGFHV